MSDQTNQPRLWTPRPVGETIEMYRDWSNSYDADLAVKRYLTPGRIANALSQHLPDGPAPVLDFGCGTGISGAALLAVGIGPLHGCDITAEMVEKAGPKGIYDTLWVADPGALDATPGDYRAIVATGVVSLGAAPPDTMDMLIDALGPGGLLAMSFNDPTLEDGSYDARLTLHLESGALELLSREHGPHLEQLDMGSDVMVLRRL